MAGGLGSVAGELSIMPRFIQATLPADRTDAAIERLGGLEGVVGLSVQRGASLRPPGDVLTVLAASDAAPQVGDTLAEHGAASAAGTLLFSEPTALVARSDQAAIDGETNESTWEEAHHFLRGEANLDQNFLALLVLSGAICGVGMWTNAMVLVVAAQVIAPHLEPYLRVACGVVVGPRRFAWAGLRSLVAGYLALLAGAALSYWALAAADGSRPLALSARPLVSYWASTDVTTLLTAALAGAAGAFVVTTRRSSWLVGCMIAVALLPAATLVGMGLASGNGPLAVAGAVRWATDSVCILVAGGLAFAAKQVFGHRRRPLA